MYEIGFPFGFINIRVPTVLKDRHPSFAMSDPGTGLCP